MAITDPKLRYQICPIVLTGGIASQVPGGMLPIIQFLPTETMGDEVTREGFPRFPTNLDNAFGAFNVLPGGTLVSQQIAKYPFANQSVAANATIREPLTISVIMDAPMRGADAWAKKHMVMTNLKGVLDTHNHRGGTYTVYTPAYMYEFLIMTSLTDNSRGNNSLPQNAWRFEFEKPLVALAELAGAQNNLMGKISNALPTDGQLSGIQVGSTVGQTTLLSRPSTGIGGQLTQGFQTVFDSGGNLPGTPLNFPAIPSMAQFPFSGIS